MKIEHGIILYIVFIIGLVLVSDVLGKSYVKETMRSLCTPGRSEKFGNSTIITQEEDITNAFATSEQDLNNVVDFMKRTSDSYETLQQIQGYGSQGKDSIDSHTLFRKFSSVNNTQKPMGFLEKPIDDKRQSYNMDTKWNVHTIGGISSESRDFWDSSYTAELEQKYGSGKKYNVEPFDTMARSYSIV